jgi:threonine synthase
MPRVVAGSSFRKNPIVHAYLNNSESCEDLNPGKIRQTSVNEPLINWHSIDGDHALEAIRQTGGWAADASDRAMRKYTTFHSTKRRIAGAAGFNCRFDSTDDSS